MNNRAVDTKESVAQEWTHAASWEVTRGLLCASVFVAFLSYMVDALAVQLESPMSGTFPWSDVALRKVGQVRPVVCCYATMCPELC